MASIPTNAQWTRYGILDDISVLTFNEGRLFRTISTNNSATYLILVLKGELLQAHRLLYILVWLTDVHHALGDEFGAMILYLEVEKALVSSGSGSDPVFSSWLVTYCAEVYGMMHREVEM